MIPSLLQIPSAVSDSKLHSVLPNNGKGDFTFDRSTGATRINRDGLIEEVGYFSSELVQNGNFSELGSELVTNGDFATDSDWTKQTGWSISDGVASVTSAASGRQIYQNVLTIGKYYKATFEITSISAGGFKIMFGSGSDASSEFNTVGTHTVYFEASADRFGVRTFGTTTGSIDNVSVKQVDPNDRWTLGTGWSYGDGVASCDGTQTSNTSLQQSGIAEVGKIYKISFDLTVTTGYINYVNLGGWIDNTDLTETGTYSYITTTTTATDNFGIAGASNFVGTVDNVSVVEVQGDRPRLSYDITNGVVESQPHLLLEPSSTNLIEYSQDFTTRSSKWQPFGNVEKELNTVISPDGTRNASKITGLNGSGSNDLRYAFSFNTANKTVTYSVYLKGSGTLRLQVSNGVDQAFNNTITLSDKWQRFSVSGTFGSTSVSVVYLVIDDYISLTATEYDIWGAQFEEQSYATSYIPTAGTTITRAAETCNNSKPSIYSAEGAFYAEVALNGLAPNSYIQISDNSYNNRVAFINNNSATSWRTFYRVGGASQIDSTASGLDVFEMNKIALSWKVNEFKFYVNGTEIIEDTSGSVNPANTFTRIDFSDINNTNKFYGKVKGLAVYNEALTDAQLIELTS